MSHWTIISWVLMGAAGLAALWAVVGDRARGRLRCPGGWGRVLWVVPWRRGCWYDMSGAAVPCRCPECGREWAGERQLRRRRVRYRVFAVVAVLLAGAYVASVMWRVKLYGWRAATPYWVLVAFAPIDNLAGYAIGEPASHSQMSWQERLFLSETWGRPAWWESAILKMRLERALAEGASGTYVVGVHDLENASRWDAPGPFNMGHRARMRSNSAIAAVHISTVSRQAREGTRLGPSMPGIQVLSGPGDVMAEPAAILQALADCAGREGKLYEYPAIECLPRESVCLHDLSRISPGLRRWPGPGGSPGSEREGGQAPPGTLIEDPLLTNLEEMLSACLGIRRGVEEPALSPTALVTMPGIALVRGNDDTQAAMAAVVSAMGDAWVDDLAVSPARTLADGSIVRAYNVVPLLDATGPASEWPWRADPSITRVTGAVFREVTAVPARATRRVQGHGRVVVVIGDEDHHEIARATIARLVAERTRVQDESEVPP